MTLTSRQADEDVNPTSGSFWEIIRMATRQIEFLALICWISGVCIVSPTVSYVSAVPGVAPFWETNLELTSLVLDVIVDWHDTKYHCVNDVPWRSS
ncbi:hypothetical protein J6590_024958 [Homalodisca vitripennis]|nr:hypothetical protein J6590_024958 [Homalodisca vitripennis]